MQTHPRSLLAAFIILLPAACAPAKSDPPAAVQTVSAATRQEAFAKIEPMVRKEPTVRHFRGNGDSGWVEEHQIINIEEVSTETLPDNKRRMTVRINSSASMWKTKGSKKIGEPTIRRKSTTKNYIF